MTLAYILVGCGQSRPAHSYVFSGYTTTADGDRAYVFESDEMEGTVGATYDAICVGHITDGGKADGNCGTIRPYLHHMLPPTYYSAYGDDSYLDIPSLNLEFEIEDAY